MPKYNEEYDTIKQVLSQTIKVYKGKTEWKDDNTLIFKKSPKKEEGQLILKDKSIETKGKIIDDIFKDVLKVYKNAEKNKVKATDVVNTPLKDMLSSVSKFNELDRNPVLVKKLNKELEKLQISVVKMEGSVSQSSSIFTEPKLAISTNADENGQQMESGYWGRLRTALFDGYETGLKRKEDINLREIYKFRDLEGEKITKLELLGMEVGQYHPERNLVHLYFNPFKLCKFSVFDTELPKVLTQLLKMLKEVGVKKNNVTDIQEKIFITEFMKKSRDRLATLKSSRTSLKNDITTWERSIRSNIEKFHEILGEIDFIQQKLDTNGSGLVGEVMKMKKLPFIEDVKMEGATIDIKFTPTFIPAPEMFQSDMGKRFGKRYMWIGSIGFKIHPDKFDVYGDVNIDEHCHPHANSFPEGTPCFGSGPGRNKIYELLAANKFSSMAKMLWFWIKTYRNSGAHIHVGESYNSILRQGYPIYDEKGVKIEINDPERIKSGEQVKLTKESNYNENQKKFGNVKLIR